MMQTGIFSFCRVADLGFVIPCPVPSVSIASFSWA